MRASGEPSYNSSGKGMRKRCVVHLDNCWIKRKQKAGQKEKQKAGQKEKQKAGQKEKQKAEQKKEQKL